MRIIHFVRSPLTVCLALAISVVACNRPPDDPKDYAARIASARAAKDTDFQRDNDPIPRGAGLKRPVGAAGSF